PQAARERADAEQATQEARNRLFDAIECVDESFALYDHDDRLVVCNKQYRELHPDVAALIVPGARLEDLVRAGLGRSDEQSSQAEGDGVDAMLQGRGVADGSAAIPGFGDVWLMSDVGRAHAGGVIVPEPNIAELKGVDIAKDEFRAMVTHELRTPLTSIRS